MEIGVVCTVLGIIISYITFYVNSKKDIKKETKDDTERSIRLEMKLDNISNSVNEIRLEQKDTTIKIVNKTTKIVNQLHERLLFVEATNKNLNKRIDKLEDDKTC